MTDKINDIAISHSSKHVTLDMSDCYTQSFREFVPFCLHLYYFSNFKDFKTSTQA